MLTMMISAVYSKERTMVFLGVVGPVLNGDDGIIDGGISVVGLC